MRLGRWLLAWWLLLPAGALAQSGGILSTPLTVQSVSVTSSGTTALVAAQGSGVKIRVLGFLFSSYNQARVQLQDGAGTACTGALTISTASSVNVPMAGPSYVCETAANQALNVVITEGVSPRLGGVLLWQPAY